MTASMETCGKIDVMIDTTPFAQRGPDVVPEEESHSYNHIKEVEERKLELFRIHQGNRQLHLYLIISDDDFLPAHRGCQLSDLCRLHHRMSSFHMWTYLL